MKRLWRGEIFTVCCFGTWCNVYRQTERKYYLLPVVNPIKFVETLFHRIVYYQLSVVCWVIWQAVQTSILLTFFKRVRCGGRQCCITHSLSMRDWIGKPAYHDRSTHFLLVIWCTIMMGSFTKNQNWAMSLTSCWLWDKTTDHKRKHYSQTVVMRQSLNASSC